MPPASFLIKPVSSACNLRCSYCFYRDVASNRKIACSGLMSAETLEAVIAQAMRYAEDSCTFAFQGGEPTLAGLDFYRQVLALEEKYSNSDVAIYNTIQTNGILLDEAWAHFLAENQFLVGLSLDGPAFLHDHNRKGPDGAGSCSQVMRSAELMDRFHVAYNILCVVTVETAAHTEQVYRFFRKHGFQWLQFIPCLDPIAQDRGLTAFHLSPSAYGDFLVRIFDVWLADLRKKEYISIRHLDNWMHILLGEPPESCDMIGCCSVQFVVESSGHVYPCDFYVLDPWDLGSIHEQSFSQMIHSATAQAFLKASHYLPDECAACPLYPICRNGCRRNRVQDSSGNSGVNYYCESYRHFFFSRKQQLAEAVRLIRDMRRELT